jgi:hypothetical protein
MPMREVFEPLNTIVDSVGVELGLTLKTIGVMTSTDKDTRQIGFLISETCQDLLTRKPWRKIIGTNPWVLKVDNTYSYALVADSDTPIFDSRVLKLGAKWRYMQSKGFTYDEIFRAYEKRIYDFAYDYNAGEMVNTNADATEEPTRS